MEDNWFADYIKNSLFNRFPRWNVEILVFFLIFAVGVFILYQHYKPSLKKALLWVLTYLYSYNILIVVLLMREPIKDNFNFAFLSMQKDTVTLDFIFNIIMFVPLGILLMTFFKERAFVKTISIGLLSTVTVELVQGLSKLGTCELVDIISNFLGAVIGGLIYIAVRYYIVNKKGKDSHEYDKSRRN
ncbi:MAG: VanZ family protein [Oscillospiraceae bacterium]